MAKTYSLTRYFRSTVFALLFCTLPNCLSAPAEAPAKTDSLQANNSPKDTLTIESVPPLDSLESVFDSLVEASLEQQPVPSDSSAQDTSGTLTTLLGLDSNFIYDYITHPVLGILTWPVEYLMVPGIKLALYPMRPPIEYMLKENVLDRTIDLLSYGKKDQILFYPIVTITTGTGSQTGLGYIHKLNALGHKHRLAIKYRFYVDGNQKIQFRNNIQDLGGTPVGMEVAVDWIRRKNQSFTPPRPRGALDSAKQYSDTTWGYSLSLNIPLFESWSLSPKFIFRDHEYSLPTLKSRIVSCQDGYFFEMEDCIEKRGLNQDYKDYIYILSLRRYTLNNPNIPSTGSSFKIDGEYHHVTKNHSYYEWNFKLINYIFLGVERYEISSSEQKELGTLNFQKIKDNLKMNTLKKKLLKRKVIATQVTLGQMYEIEGQTAPFYALKAMGNQTPLRGYIGSPFRDYALASVSAEYRFPIMNLIEGTIFNEYGIVGESVNNLNPNALQNSWGFGVRFSRKDIFLFRAQMGFHGLSAPIMNLTIGQVFE